VGLESTGGSTGDVLECPTLRSAMEISIPAVDRPPSRGSFMLATALRRPVRPVWINFSKAGDLVSSVSPPSHSVDASMLSEEDSRRDLLLDCS